MHFPCEDDADDDDDNEDSNDDDNDDDNNVMWDDANVLEKAKIMTYKCVSVQRNAVRHHQRQDQHTISLAPSLTPCQCRHNNRSHASNAEQRHISSVAICSMLLLWPKSKHAGFK